MATYTNKLVFTRQQNRKNRLNQRIDTLILKFHQGLKATIEERMAIAGSLVRDAAKINVSVPVRRDSRRRVIERSLPGEFPRIETGRLRTDIFMRSSSTPTKITVQVGTSLNYGRILETSTRLNRSFLRRTVREMKSEILQIVGKPLTFRD